MNKLRIMSVFGTRPEAIKMCPLVKELASRPEIESLCCVTAQHRQMLDSVLEVFEVKPDWDLDIMTPRQTLSTITSKCLTGMDEAIDTLKPDMILVHGDTSTTFAGALSAFYHQVKVGHVEAGLRTYDKYSPFPEEMNRKLVSSIADLYFCPTVNNKNNLLRENITEGLFVTGNTVIDALHTVVERIRSDRELAGRLAGELLAGGYDTARLDGSRRMVLITGHRRENFGDGFVRICSAIKHLAETYPDVDFVYPMHLNPNVRRPIHEAFGNSSLPNLFLIEPLEYLPFVCLMERSAIVLTDSGGIQEEAPGLGKPVLVMRDTTERPEALDAGTVRLVGTDYDRIVGDVSALLDDPEHYRTMSQAVNPYGDGKACGRIVQFLK
mgnify:CR=1 FL=1